MIQEERWEGSAVHRGVDWLFFSPWSPLGSLASIEALLGAAGHLPLLAPSPNHGCGAAMLPDCCLPPGWGNSSCQSNLHLGKLCIKQVFHQFSPSFAAQWLLLMETLRVIFLSSPSQITSHAGHARAWFLFPFSLENQNLTIALKKGCLFFSKWFWNRAGGCAVLVPVPVPGGKKHGRSLAALTAF